jgi:hypothetical protein
MADGKLLPIKVFRIKGIPGPTGTRGETGVCKSNLEKQQRQAKRRILILKLL